MEVAQNCRRWSNLIKGTVSLNWMCGRGRRKVGGAEGRWEGLVSKSEEYLHCRHIGTRLDVGGEGRG